MAEVIRMARNSSEGLIGDVADIILERVNGELVTDSRIDLGDGKRAILIVKEEYYFRVKNYVTVTINLIEDGSAQNAVIIGAGGGSGIFNVNYGANKSYARIGEEVLRSMGFIKLYD